MSAQEEKLQSASSGDVKPMPQGRRLTILGMGPTAQERRIDIARYCEGTEIWCLNNGYASYPHLRGAFNRWFELHSWDYLQKWEKEQAPNHFRNLDALECDVWVIQPIPLVRKQRAYPIVEICEHFDTNYFLGSPSLMVMLALYEHDQGARIEELRSWGIDTSDPQHGQQRQSWAFWLSKAQERGINLEGTSTQFFAEPEMDAGLKGLRESVGDKIHARRKEQETSEARKDTAA